MKKWGVFAALAACAAYLAAPSADAVEYVLPRDGGRVVGENLTYEVPGGNISLEDISSRYQLGLSNMLEANPGVDALSPKKGTTLIIPHQLILPDTVHEGIIVNTAEMRLYYYPKDSGTVVVLPIGIGQLGRDTPKDWVTKVERKKDGPTWTPTAAMRAEYKAKGQELPAVVPAGKQNPMGLYALYVGRLYAIHGTNANFGIGLRVSHGCVRLRDADIAWLFHNVPVGTRVQFINQPVKYSREPDGSMFLEVHQSLSENEAEFSSEHQVPLSLSGDAVSFITDPEVDESRLRQALEDRTGYPVQINGFSF